MCQHRGSGLADPGRPPPPAGNSGVDRYRPGLGLLQPRFGIIVAASHRATPTAVERRVLHVSGWPLVSSGRALAGLRRPARRRFRGSAAGERRFSSADVGSAAGGQPAVRHPPPPGTRPRLSASAGRRGLVPGGFAGPMGRSGAHSTNRVSHRGLAPPPGRRARGRHGSDPRPARVAPDDLGRSSILGRGRADSDGLPGRPGTTRAGSPPHRWCWAGRPDDPRRPRA